MSRKEKKRKEDTHELTEAGNARQIHKPNLFVVHMQAASLLSYSPTCLTHPSESCPSLHPPLPSSPFPIEKKRQAIDSLEPCARIAGHSTITSGLRRVPGVRRRSDGTSQWHDHPHPYHIGVGENVVGSLTCREENPRNFSTAYITTSQFWAARRLNKTTAHQKRTVGAGRPSPIDRTAGVSPYPVRQDVLIEVILSAPVAIKTRAGEKERK
jgi:hypothetical protein